MVKLLTTDSYFNLFNVLTKELKGVRSLSEKNIIFTEEKFSLMAERCICDKFGGSFNTEVYSFGNFLRKRKKIDNLLSKEGSSMVVKRVISGIKLKCFHASKTNLAPSLYELISQLKSAKVTYNDLKTAKEGTIGVLSNKLEDISEIYRGYEEYIDKNGFKDQSSILSYLPEVLKSEEIRESNVYILGFTDGFTRQIRNAISVILDNAKSVTAILVNGENGCCFLNETQKAFKDICKEKNISFSESEVNSDFIEEGKIISENIFNPLSNKVGRFETERVRVSAFSDKETETERIAEIIKNNVLHGARYKDFTLCLPDMDKYKDSIINAFNLLEIPYFLDIKKQPINHPLVSLIYSYIELFRKNLDRDSVSAFFKNPLYCEDKVFTDKFENYLIKYNVDYSNIKNEFVFEKDGEDFSAFEDFRKNLCSFFNKFSVKEMLYRLNVKEKLLDFSCKLENYNEREQSAVNTQIYEKIENILSEMEVMLRGVDVSYKEFKDIFESGVKALELSIIPQYNDAVFIGDFKSTAIGKANYLFILGLNDLVPSFKEDTAILNDNDINELERIKVLIEPRINVVNKRTVENVGVALSAFSKAILMSYPLYSESGAENYKSEIIEQVEKLFTVKGFPSGKEYLTRSQGLKNFAKACGQFSELKTNDFSVASSYYFQCDKDERVKAVLDSASREIKVKLNKNNDLYEGVTSPTTIENFYRCPYATFMSNGLKIKDNVKGEPDGLTVGSLMHEIFKSYAENLDKVFDKESSFKLVEKIQSELFLREEYAKFLSDGKSASVIKRVIKECGRFCFRTYLSFSSSDFKAEKSNLEVKFGEGGKYPSIKLLDGKIRLEGKIDRVDTYKNYCRVIDYKTGGYDVSDKSLFAGIKLQLYLYAAAVNDKSLAGAYYIPVLNVYSSENKKSSLAVGKTLDDKELINAQDKNLFIEGKSDFLPISSEGRGYKTSSLDAISSYVKYALKVCENAGKQMLEGVIAPSPYANACENCKYFAMCYTNENLSREVSSVSEETIIDSVSGGKE